MSGFLPQHSEILLYDNGADKQFVSVVFKDETFWLTQSGMAELFDCSADNISLHLKNIYADGELEQAATTEKFSVVRKEGSREVRRSIDHYDLDAIIAVGYRVNSKKATRFRQWATKTLKEYIQKGFVLNDDLMKNGRPFGRDYFDELLERIRRKGVDIVPVLLHVGLGTFRPVKFKDVSEHVMHTEYYEVTQDAADRLNAARAHGGRIVCTGTTSVRTLETVATEDGVVHPGSGFTQIFITPGVKIKAVDALITNFHLPQSTLLMLISALMGRENALDVYRQAVEERYRFFSFGDAMMIL